MKSDYIHQVKATLSTHADPAAALKMQSYMRNKFEFLGIKAPKLRSISKPFLSKENLPPEKLVPDIASELWQHSQREYQYFAIELLKRFMKAPPKEWIEIYESLIVQKSWWDTVDGLAAWLIGNYFQLYPDQTKPCTKKWMNSNNIWLQRTCLIFQLKYKDKTDFDLMQSFIRPLTSSNEFFIKKAIGWALREYSKINPEAVSEFADSHKLSKLSYNEATRLINRQ